MLLQLFFFSRVHSNAIQITGIATKKGQQDNLSATNADGTKAYFCISKQIKFSEEEKKKGGGQYLQLVLTVHQISFHIFADIAALSFPKGQMTREQTVERFHTCVKQTVYGKGRQARKSSVCTRVCKHSINISTKCLLLTGQPSHHLGCPG